MAFDIEKLLDLIDDVPYDVTVLTPIFLKSV
jgi:hypothetical protein